MEQQKYKKNNTRQHNENRFENKYSEEKPQKTRLSKFEDYKKSISEIVKYVSDYENDELKYKIFNVCKKGLFNYYVGKEVYDHEFMKKSYYATGLHTIRPKKNTD